MPALPINDPASIKNGIAISGKESKDAKAFCAINSIGVLEVSSIVIIVAIPKAIPIGILIVSKINNNANNSNTAN
jgi:competence protein ComGC